MTKTQIGVTTKAAEPTAEARPTAPSREVQGSRDEHEDFGRAWALGYGSVTGFVQKALGADSHSGYLRACLPQIARRQAASIVVVRYDIADTDVHIAERWQRSDRNAENWAPVIDAIGWEAENEGRPVGRLLHRSDIGIETVGMACPLFAPGGASAGFLAVLTETEGDPSPQFLLGQLSGTTALVNAGLRPTASAASPRAVPDATSALARAGRHPDLRSYGHVLASGLRDRLGCEQVLFGVVRNPRVEVLAISGIDDVQARSSTVDRIGQAMGECLDRDEPILCQIEQPTTTDSPSEDDALAMAKGPVPAIHKRWHEESDFSGVLSIPLRCDGKVCAVVSFVRTRRVPFRANEVEQLVAATAAVGPAVDLLKTARRSLGAHTRDSLRRAAGSWRGLRSIRRATITAGLAAAFGWFWFGTMDHSVVVEGRIEPAEMVHLTAPFEARLVETFSEAGDTVEAGQLICRFETTDLELELAQHEADAETHALESQQALAIGDVQAANLSEARQRVAIAKAATLRQRILAASIEAPFRGRLLRGDLEQRIGQILPLGEPLFELAPTEKASELRLQIPEEHALEVETDAEVRFLSNARPDARQEFVIRKVAPAASVVDAENVFLLTAEPRDAESVRDLRAGMEGLCEVSLGEAPVWRVALGPLIRWSNRNLWW